MAGSTFVWSLFTTTRHEARAAPFSTGCRRHRIELIPLFMCQTQHLIPGGGSFGTKVGLFIAVIGRAKVSRPKRHRSRPGLNPGDAGAGAEGLVGEGVGCREGSTHTTREGVLLPQGTRGKAMGKWLG